MDPFSRKEAELSSPSQDVAFICKEKQRNVWNRHGDLLLRKRNIESMSSQQMLGSSGIQAGKTTPQKPLYCHLSVSPLRGPRTVTEYPPHLTG